MKSLIRFFELWQWAPSPLALQLSRNLPHLGSFSRVSSFPHCPRWAFDFNWSIQILKVQFSIIDQILDLVFECDTIFRGMTWIPAMVVASSVGIVPSWKWGSEWCQLNWLNVTNLYQLWEQLSVSDRDGVPSGPDLVNLLSIRFAP